MKLILEYSESGSKVKISFDQGDSPTRIAIQLACATRMIAKSLADAIGKKGEEEQIEASIANAYMRDITEFGALGEKVERLDNEEGNFGEGNPL